MTDDIDSKVHTINRKLMICTMAGKVASKAQQVVLRDSMPGLYFWFECSTGPHEYIRIFVGRTMNREADRKHSYMFDVQMLLDLKKPDLHIEHQTLKCIAEVCAT